MGAVTLSALLRVCLGAAAVGPLAACAVADDSGAFSGLVAQHHPASGSVSFSGSIPGTWRPSADQGGACGAGAVVIWIEGPGPGDRGALQVKSDGSILVDIEKYGDYLGSGATFRSSEGFSLDADVTTARGKQAHVEGTLNC